MKTHWCCLLYRTSQHEWQPMPFINFTSNDSNSNLSDHYEFWVPSVVLEVAWIPRASTILQYASVDRAKDWTLRACWRWFLRLDYLQRRVFGHGAVASKSVVSTQKSWDTPKVMKQYKSDPIRQGARLFFVIKEKPPNPPVNLVCGEDEGFHHPVIRVWNPFFRTCGVMWFHWTQFSVALLWLLDCLDCGSSTSCD